jgi:hypothetical protein
MLFKPFALCAAVMLLLSLPASAVTAVMLYNTTPLGGSVYRYDYSIQNNGSLGAGVPIQLFDILFDPSLYLESSLLSVTPDPPASQWTEQFLTSLPGVPAAYDVMALGGGIPDGSTVSGFAVRFTWLGPGLPGSQPYRIYSPSTFELLESGITGAPEPAGFCLIGISLALGAWKRYRARA